MDSRLISNPMFCCVRYKAIGDSFKKLIIETHCYYSSLNHHYFLHKSHSTKSDIPNTESVLYQGVAIIEK